MLHTSLLALASSTSSSTMVSFLLSMLSSGAGDLYVGYQHGVDIKLEVSIENCV